MARVGKTLPKAKAKAAPAKAKAAPEAKAAPKAKAKVAATKARPRPKPAVAKTPRTAATKPLPVVAEAPARPAPRLDSTRALGLDDADWRWATWRSLPPLPVAPPVPFDLASILERLKRLVRPIERGAGWDFAGAGLSAGMSKEEARVWLECMLGIERSVSPEKKSAQLATRKLAPLTFAEVARRCHASSYDPAPELALVLARLFSPMQVTTFFLEDRPPTGDGGAGGHFFHGLREHVLPLLDDTERDALRRQIAPAITIRNFASEIVEDDVLQGLSNAADFVLDHFKEPSAPFFLAPLLGMHGPLLEVVSALPVGTYVGERRPASNNLPQLLIFGLGNADLVVEHMGRLRLSLDEPAWARAWLAHTEYAQLDAIAEAVIDLGKHPRAAKVAEVLARVRAPENVGPMLAILARSKVPAIGAAWLEENVGHAAAGYVALMAGGGPMAGAAAARLKALKDAGHGDLVARVSQESDQGTTLRAALALVDHDIPELEEMPGWLAKPYAQARSSKTKPPPWVTLDALPPVCIGDRRLAPEQVRSLVVALAESGAQSGNEPFPTLAAARPLVKVVKEHATPASCDAFAWALFEQWLLAGAPSSHRWAMIAVGLLGGDASALKLAPRIREWPGQSLHQRAVTGIDVLGQIGSDVALVQIADVARRVYFPALKRRADEVMAAFAKRRKLSRDELEDSIVPHGGFDDQGRRQFQLGSRRFEVVLGPDATPLLRDTASGARLAALPEPTSGDDIAEAKRQIGEWATLKATLEETFKAQAQRLEQSMVKGRRWSVNGFEHRLLRHPLMGHLARTLVWGVWAKEKGASPSDASALTRGPVATFRVAEDGTLADADDEAIALPTGDVEIGIAHPLDLDGPSRHRWGVLLADYETLPPFEQLSRTIHGVEPGETTDFAPRFAGQTWPSKVFLDLLRDRGWTHGSAGGGVIGTHHKRFPGGRVTALLRHNAYHAGQTPDDATQAIHAVCFVRGDDAEGRFFTYLTPSGVPLAKVDPRAISEVLYDLAAL